MARPIPPWLAAFCVKPKIEFHQPFTFLWYDLRMARFRSLRIKPRWRLFRAGSGRASGLAPMAYVLLYLASLAMSEWNSVRYGTIVVWPANGVALAALLQLHRREAVRV